jgi:hypothetical protein
MYDVLFVRALVPGLLTLGLVTAPVRAAEPVQLITRSEANLPALDAVSSQERNLTRGPGIDRIAPATIGLDGGPFRFAVKFKPRNGVPIDPASVRLTYRRQPTIDLTPRIKAFVSPEGIEAPAVIAPPGRHIVEIEVTDRQGRIGRSQITLTIDGPK